MKRAYIWVALLLLSAASPLSSDAQILKNLVNNMKQNIGNKSPGQPGAASGKPDSGSRGKGSYDSTYLAQMLAKANKPKPSISAADSAAAIKGFMTGTGGSGLFYQYHVIYTFKKNNKDSTTSDTLSTAVTDGHNLRTDLGMLGVSMRVLGHAGMPRYSVLVYPESKTFVFNIIDTAAINSGGGMVYQVAKVGNERVLGYNCIHSKLTIYPAGVKSGGTTEDIWTSTDVPGYADLKKLTLNQNVTPKMMQALEQAGCGGSFVKMELQSKAISMEMQLITAERRNFPASMFQIPPGYSQKSSSNPFAR